MKHRYYEFWIQSSRGTDATIIRLYKGKPSRKKLEYDAQEWASEFTAMHVSENHVSYGWREIKGSELPKGRAEILKIWNRVCKAHKKVSTHRRRIQNLLALPPYNGEKL